MIAGQFSGNFIAYGYKLARGCTVWESSLGASVTFSAFLEESHEDGVQISQRWQSSPPRTLAARSAGVKFFS